MARTNKTDRKTCRQAYPSISLSPTAERQANTIIDTPRRTRLLCDARSTVSKLTRKELFKKHNIIKATGYRILKSKMARRSERIHNRDRKAVLAPHERDTIKIVENASFRFETSTHLAVTSTLGLINDSERAI